MSAFMYIGFYLFLNADIYRTNCNLHFSICYRCFNLEVR